MTAFVRPRRVEDPVLRLVVFHHAGGSAASYYPLTHGLPAGWDLLLLDLPGRGRRHAAPPLEEMSALVAQATEDLLPWTGRVPLALFGHSLGSVVAFEVAHALQARGLPPAWVGVSGRVAPDEYVPVPGLDPSLPDEELTRGLSLLGGLPERLHEVPEFRRRFLRLIRTDLKALLGYRPAPRRQPLRAPLTAFGATDDPLAPPGALDAWARETQGEFTRCLLPGGHFHFLGDSFARFTSVLTAEIRARVCMSIPPEAARAAL